LLKRIAAGLAAAGLVAAGASSSGAGSPTAPAAATAEEKAASPAAEARHQDALARSAWWREARFGMFVHFGAYAVPARGEWVQSNERLSAEKYLPYVEGFRPVEFDARAWARLARAAGMRYAVLTAKHHDGFCLFDSALTDYKISARFGGRDLVREFLDAFRAEGLRVGLYYSLIDWHHPDYPNVGNHPMRDDAEFGKRPRLWSRYLDYMHGQVEELVTTYGRLDLLWLDFSFGEHRGEKWGAERLVAMVRKHQPAILLNNRLDVNPGVSGTARSLGPYGDFETPEQGLPDAGLADAQGRPIPWETCLTLNNNWGYHATDHEWKSPELVVHTLVEAVSKNGNLLLNVGPDGRGRIPEPSVRVLEEVGRWMSRNSESVHGAGAADLPRPEWGRFTRRGQTLYAHWLYPRVGHINLGAVGERVTSVRLLHDGSEAKTARTWWGDEGKGNFFVNVAEPTYQTFRRPDPIDTVFEVRLR
jgi:alpha-L-fucosidase